MSVLDLSNAHLLGSGNERQCYIYPGKEDLCIKVNHQGVVHRSQNRIESYYLPKLKSRKVPFTYLPEFYGQIETNFGPGLVIERVRNSDGTAPERLDLAVKSGSVSKQEANDLLSLLYQYCYQYGIYIGDINKDQILLKNVDGQRIPVIIDGLGTRRYGWKLFLLSNFRFLARRKLKKSWSILLQELDL